MHKRATSTPSKPAIMFFLLLSLWIAGGFMAFSLNKRHEAQHFARYEEIVLLVRQGRLKANASGDILLSKSWAWVTKNGHVYQTHDQQSDLTLLFPTDVDTYHIDWPGGETTTERQIAGHIYCSDPLPADRWFTFTGMKDVKVWDEIDTVRPHWFIATPYCD